MFLCLFQVIAADPGLGPPSNFQKILGYTRKIELVGSAAPKPNSEFRFAPTFQGQRYIAVKAKRGSSSFIRLKNHSSRTNSRQITNYVLNQTTARWTNAQKHFVACRIYVPRPRSTVNEFCVMTTGYSTLFRIVWKRESWGYRDSYFALVSPDGKDDNVWMVYYLGPRKRKTSTKFSVFVDRNNFVVEMDNKVMIDNPNLTNYGSNKLFFMAGVAMNNYMASSASSSAVVLIAI